MRILGLDFFKDSLPVHCSRWTPRCFRRQAKALWEQKGMLEQAGMDSELKSRPGHLPFVKPQTCPSTLPASQCLLHKEGNAVQVTGVCELGRVGWQMCQGLNNGCYCYFVDSKADIWGEEST